MIVLVYLVDNQIGSIGNRIRSANLHVNGSCNYHCDHCFSRCLRHHGIMGLDGWRPIIDYLKLKGIEKVNIAGGEPMLYPYLDEMCILLKEMGFIVSIVSNGSLITEEWLSKMAGVVDWIGLSIDSPDEKDEIEIGRYQKGKEHLKNIINVCDLAHKYGFKVKLNITVVRRSCHKDFTGFIKRVNAERVKVFRALTIKNANDDIEDTWSITDEEYDDFRRRHLDCDNIVFEDNGDMVGTYMMFSPKGKWMVNIGSVKRFLDFEILQNEGVESRVNVDGYYGRGAVYW